MLQLLENLFGDEVTPGNGMFSQNFEKTINRSQELAQQRKEQEVSQ